MSEIRVTSVVGENGGDRVRLTTGLTVGPLTGRTGIGATISHQGHAQFAGVCTATSFVGNGANLTGLTETITSGAYTSLGTGTYLDLSTGDSTNIIKYELMFRAVSTNGSNDWQFQLGDAGGIETSGYSVVAGYDGSNEGTSSRTDGFRWTGAGSAGFIMDGKFSLTRIHSNIWWGVGDLVRTEGGSTLYYFKGSKELSAAITQIRIMASSNLSTNFDGGSVKLISYKGTV